MTSQIDATQPTTGSASTGAVRSNFAYAKSEIEALQTSVSANQSSIASLQTSVSAKANAPVVVSDGGTGITTYAVGDLLYANTATTLAKLPITTTIGHVFQALTATSAGYGRVRAAYILSASAVRASHTGTTSEVTLVAVAVPGNTMGANGILRISVLLSKIGTAGDATVQTKFGGTVYRLQTMTSASSALSAYNIVHVANRNNTSSQVGAAALQANLAATATSVVASSHDTTTTQNINITGQLTNSTDAIAVESYYVEVLGP